MDNNMTLKDWMQLHNIDKDNEVVEYEKMFYKIDKAMKRLHENGYYVTSFNVDNINVGDSINFKYIENNSLVDMTHKNIYYLSCLAIGIYSGSYDHHLINPENSYLKEHYNDFKEFIPKDVVRYYDGIIERDATVYLSDYMRAKRDRDLAREQRELNEGGRSFNKSTMAGRLTTEDNKNTAAFALVYLFPAIISFLAILIPILVIINS